MAVIYVDGYFVNNGTFRGKDIKSLNCLGRDWENNSMDYAFKDCFNLIDVTDIGPNITSMVGAFENCQSIVTQPMIPNNVTNISGAFKDCHNLLYSSISNGAQDVSYIYQDCTNLFSTSIIPQSITNMSHAFENTKVVEIEGNFDNVVDANAAFKNCSNINYVNLTFRSVTNMHETFSGCSNLNGIINIVNSKVMDATDCFNNSSLDKDVYIPFQYVNGTYSETYNTFTSSGYPTEEPRVNGVLLIDSEALLYNVDLSDYDYSKNDVTKIVTLTKYVGSGGVVVQPRLIEELI